MSNHTDQMRLFMKLTEADYTGPIDSPNIAYSAEEKKGEITKVIATLNSHDSGRYTKLGRNLNRIKWLSDKIDQLKEEVKADTKGAIADLFHADDACRTRVVETVSFTFEMTKDPKPTTTVQYSKVLEALEEHLTPELIAVMEGLKAQFSNVTQKSPGLKAKDKRYESIEEAIQLEEGFLDKIKDLAKRFYAKVASWGKSYDAKLDKLKAMAAQAQPAESVAEGSDMFGHPDEDAIDSLIETAINLGKAMGGMISDEQINHWKSKVAAEKEIVMRLLKDY